MYMRIKDISKENRPRERFQKLGASALSDAELLAIILQKGSKEENVIDMSNRLITKYGLNKLSDLSLNEIQEIKGIGPAKAMQIKALFEFNKRHSLAKMNNSIIKSARDVFDYASKRLPSKDKEHFMILHLDSRSRIIKDEVISIGTLNASIIHPRERCLSQQLKRALMQLFWFITILQGSLLLPKKTVRLLEDCLKLENY